MVPFKKDPLDENCRDWAYRPVPMYWPHEVLHYMFESVGIKIPEAKLKEYWAQARHYKLPWAKGSEDDTSPRIPVKLFGDDARYNQQGDKLLAFIISCPLWRPASGRAARWPVAVVSLHGNLGFPTMQPLLHEIVWSLNQAFDVPSRTGLLFQCTELGGDWKYHRESLNLQCHWNSESMCHFCSLPRHRFPEFPEPLPDRTFVQFVNDALEPGWPSPLILLRRFHLSVLQWCLLHTVHPGLLWTANGGCIDYLLQLGGVWKHKIEASSTIEQCLRLLPVMAKATPCTSDTKTFHCKHDLQESEWSLYVFERVECQGPLCMAFRSLSRYMECECRRRRRAAAPHSCDATSIITESLFVGTVLVFLSAYQYSNPASQDINGKVLEHHGTSSTVLVARL